MQKLSWLTRVIGVLSLVSFGILSLAIAQTTSPQSLNQSSTFATTFAPQSTGYSAVVVTGGS